MKVELKQIVGKGLGNPDGPKIATDVFFVRVDGATIGFEGEDAEKWCAVGHIHRSPTAHVKFFRRLPDELYPKIVAEVKKLRSASDKFAKLGPEDLADRSTEEEDEDDDE